MSETVIATLVIIVILAAMFAWVPLLHLVCPPCIHFLESRRRRRLPVARRTTFTVPKKAA